MAKREQSYVGVKDNDTTRLIKKGKTLKIQIKKIK